MTRTKALPESERRFWLELAEGMAGYFEREHGVPFNPAGVVRLYESFTQDWVCDACGHDCEAHSIGSEDDLEWRDRRCRTCACERFVELEDWEEAARHG